MESGEALPAHVLVVHARFTHLGIVWPIGIRGTPSSSMLVSLDKDDSWCLNIVQQSGNLFGLGLLLEFVGRGDVSYTANTGAESPPADFTFRGLRIDTARTSRTVWGRIGDVTRTTASEMDVYFVTGSHDHRCCTLRDGWLVGAPLIS